MAQKLNNPDYEQGQDNTYTGTNGNDVISGVSSNDTLIGLDGNDVLNGDSGTQNVNYINNSYEFHDGYNRGGWGLFEEVNGWHYEGKHKIELQRSGTVGQASDGKAVLELDSTGNSTVYRDIDGLDDKMTYTLSFDYSPRPGVSADSNTIEVYWDGVLLDTISQSGKGNKGFEWTTYTYEVKSSDGDARLTFKGAGKEDSLGGTVDNVKLTGENTSFNAATDGGDDLLIGGDGDDVLNGGAGNDVLEGGKGADKLDGGTGDRDTATFEKSEGGVYVNLETGEGKSFEAEGDEYADLEYVHGSHYDDTIIGDDSVNRLSGHNGDDVLNGGGGNDILLGGAGADQIDGGAGNRDAAEYMWSTEGVNVNLETGTGSGGHAEGDQLANIEYVYGSLFDDTLTGDDGVNRLVGKDGNDILNGGGGNDVLVGGLGADAMDGGAGSRDAADYKQATEGVGVNLSTGGFAGEANGDTYKNLEFVYGSAHNDDITGDDGVNRLVGNAGDDILNGAGGNDYLIGMQGNDTMTGGAGNDVYLFKAAFGSDVITDFEAGDGRTDRIWIDFVEMSSMSEINMSDTDEGALLDFGTFGTLLLEDVTVAELREDDFIF
ncbi:MAG: hypothetical protein AAF468_11710 [Pseudomonadota bacterium]